MTTFEFLQKLEKGKLSTTQAINNHYKLLQVQILQEMKGQVAIPLICLDCGRRIEEGNWCDRHGEDTHESYEEQFISLRDEE